MSEQNLFKDSPVPHKFYESRMDTKVSGSITITSVILHITLDRFFSLNLKLLYIIAK